MQLLYEIEESIKKQDNRNAFFIDDIFYTYNEFAKSISGIRELIRKSIPKSEKKIGLMANIDLDTYASIVAIWMEGKAYVPISPDAPSSRNETILNQIGIHTIIDSSTTPILSGYNILESRNLPEVKINLTPEKVTDEDLSFILFTSGSTGIPKGVPITLANITSFIDSFFNLGYKIDENDKILQMYELTFDASVMLFLIPLLKGSCIYTVPKHKIKLSYVHELLEDHNLTVLLFLPSTLFYLRPFFDELCFESLKLCMLGGEALPLDIAEEWIKCIPNANTVNLYGPTENSIVSSYYKFSRTEKIKAYNGIVSIGLPLGDCKIIIIDENNKILGKSEKGEICLAGTQLSEGYLNDKEKNREVFINLIYQGEETRFYRTGDLGFFDEDGDLMFIGRIDFQAKIKGYRVELTEVEFYAKAALNKKNVIAVPYCNKMGETDLGLIIESEECNIDDQLNNMKTKIPFYMIPSKVKFINEFPLNKNGKVDRKALEQLFIP